MSKKINDDIELEYKKKFPFFELLRDEAEFILNRKIQKEKIKVHTIEKRIKDVKSLLRKCDRQTDTEKVSNFDPFIQIKDIVGLRIICLFREDINKIEEFVKKEFDVVSYEDKVNQSTDSFGYMSVHFILQLKKELNGARYDDIKNIQFELQIRTISMHAWAVISHFIDYKSDADVPSHLKKSLNALSALFYVADTQFENFIKDRKAALIELENKSPEKLSQQEINLDSLNTFLNIQFSKRINPNNHPSQSELVEELKRAGYNTIQEVHADLERGKKAFEKYEKEHPPANDSKFAAVGVVRVTLSIVNPKFRETRNKSDTRKNLYQQYEEYIT
ncbi:MAG TPA: hypothetical protein VFT64_09805 [Rickettsiales bacterium]|nr:hypothetical protein [Rickettsiales bacterium]